MEFVLTINIGNAAMLDGNDLNEALGKVQYQLAGLELATGQGGRIADRNGNTVGSWEVVE